MVDGAKVVQSPTVIALSGCSRSGKSRLAKALGSKLGARVIGQDSYWKGAVKGSEEDPKCTDWNRFYKDLIAAIKKSQASGFVVVEGFQVLHDERIAKAATLSYHLDISKEEAIRRRSAKSSKERPNPNPKPEKYCEEVLWPTHAKYVAESVDNSLAVRFDVEQLQIEEIAARIIADAKGVKQMHLTTVGKVAEASIDMAEEVEGPAKVAEVERVPECESGDMKETEGNVEERNESSNIVDSG
eukprot:TRINITY_DN30622_c0_g1_i1.p1 TRINITY_DN30622_c0_g1~~TRINITY_DN30622_c0_g1_i1.p1  ORF type:complete len:243 (+),score=52.94 TRINITY_DN30622_c0_g1_i1:118-846(+)